MGFHVLKLNGAAVVWSQLPEVVFETLAYAESWTGRIQEDQM